MCGRGFYSLRLRMNKSMRQIPRVKLVLSQSSLFFSHLNLCSARLLRCTPDHRNSAGPASRIPIGPAWPPPSSRLAASLCYRWICCRSSPFCSSLLYWRNTPLQTNMASVGEWTVGKACGGEMQGESIKKCFSLFLFKASCEMASATAILFL